MAARDEIKVRCPACGAKYRVPAKAVGQKARCVRCKSPFRVVDPLPDSNRAPAAEKTRAQRPEPARDSKTLRHPPTEDDIVRWLSEGADEDERPATRPQLRRPQEPAARGDTEPASAETSVVESAPRGADDSFSAAVVVPTSHRPQLRLVVPDDADENHRSAIRRVS